MDAWLAIPEGPLDVGSAKAPQLTSASVCVKQTNYKTRMAMATSMKAKRTMPKAKRVYSRSAPAPTAAIRRLVAASKESGFVDTTAAAYVFDTTGTITLLNTVAQGTTVNQRVGKKIFLKSLQCHGQVLSDATAVTNDIALIIVYDKRPTGALPAITDVLNTANSSSFNNDANSGRFRILKRWDLVLVGNTTTPQTGREAEEADFYLNLRDLPTTFKAAGTGAIADQEEGSLLLITVGSNVAGTTAAAGSLGFRLRFLDC